jgi:hypothetical protein
VFPAKRNSWLPAYPQRLLKLLQLRLKILPPRWEICVNLLVPISRQVLQIESHLFIRPLQLQRANPLHHFLCPFVVMDPTLPSRIAKLSLTPHLIPHLDPSQAHPTPSPTFRCPPLRRCRSLEYFITRKSTKHSNYPWSRASNFQLKPIVSSSVETASIFQWTLSTRRHICMICSRCRRRGKKNCVASSVRPWADAYVLASWWTMVL